jgi:plastocyanin
VEVGDYFYAPAKLTVKRGTTVTWRWPSGGGDSHDVELTRAPKGVRPFVSDIATAGYSFRRRLTKPGSYTFTCSLHDEMSMRIRVR